MAAFSKIKKETVKLLTKEIISPFIEKHIVKILLSLLVVTFGGQETIQQYMKSEYEKYTNELNKTNKIITAINKSRTTNDIKFTKIVR